MQLRRLTALEGEALAKEADTLRAQTARTLTLAQALAPSPSP